MSYVYIIPVTTLKGEYFCLYSIVEATDLESVRQLINVRDEPKIKFYFKSFNCTVLISSGCHNET